LLRLALHFRGQSVQGFIFSHNLPMFSLKEPILSGKNAIMVKEFGLPGLSRPQIPVYIVLILSRSL